MEVVFSWLLLLVALLFLVNYLNDIRHNWHIATWTETEGELSHCHLNNEKQKYRLTVQYQYQVGEQTFVSDTLQSPYDAEPFFSKKVRELSYRLLRAFENHQKIAVFYNPCNPNEAVLYRSSSHRLYIYCVIFIVFITAHLARMLNWI